MTAPRVVGSNPSDPWPVVNEALDILAHQEVYGIDPDTTAGLTLGLLGGRWGGFSYTTGTLTLTNTAENYVVVKLSDGVPSVSTATTNWNNLAEYTRAYTSPWPAACPPRSGTTERGLVACMGALIHLQPLKRSPSSLRLEMRALR